MNFRSDGNRSAQAALFGKRIGREDPCCGPLCVDPVRWQAAMICDARLSGAPEGLRSTDGETTNGKRDENGKKNNV